MRSLEGKNVAASIYTWDLPFMFHSWRVLIYTFSIFSWIIVCIYSASLASLLDSKIIYLFGEIHVVNTWVSLLLDTLFAIRLLWFLNKQRTPVIPHFILLPFNIILLYYLLSPFFYKYKKLFYSCRLILKYNSFPNKSWISSMTYLKIISFIVWKWKMSIFIEINHVIHHCKI